MLEFLNHGPLMDDAGDGGGGGGDLAIADGIGDVNLDASIDTGDDVATSEPDEPASTGTPVSTGQEIIPFKGRAIQDGKISPAAKPFLDEIRTKSPALEKQIRNALVRQDVLNREFPGGVQAVRAKIAELEGIIQELGGQDGITSTNNELSFFRDIDRQFTAADPRFIDALVADPQGQAAFIKLAPSLIDRYAALHPEGFETWLNGKLKGEMDRSGVNISLIQMRNHWLRLPESPERVGIIEEWNNLVGPQDGSAGFYNRIAALAGRKVEPPKLEPPAPKADDPREQELARREGTLKEEEFTEDWNSLLRKSFESNWKELMKGRTLNDIEQGNARELFVSILSRCLRADVKTQDNLKKLYAASNRSGYRALAKTTLSKEVPTALTEALDRSAHTKPNRSAGAATSNGGAPRIQPQASATPVRTIPASDTIDFKLTQLNKYTVPDADGYCHAVLKNGAKVKFKR